MSEIRDDIYLHIESKRLEQEREGYTADTYKQELIMILVTARMLLRDVCAQ